MEVYDRSVLFTRSGQYELHRSTIERRRALGSAEELTLLASSPFAHVVRGVGAGGELGKRHGRYGKRRGERSRIDPFQIDHDGSIEQAECLADGQPPGVGS